MLRCFNVSIIIIIIILFGCVSKAPCVQSSCRAEQESGAAQGAPGCGCGNPQRAAAAAVEERAAAPVDSAVKYSKGANEGPPEAGGEGEGRGQHSQVSWGTCDDVTVTSNTPSCYVVVSYVAPSNSAPTKVRLYTMSLLGFTPPPPQQCAGNPPHLHPVSFQTVLDKTCGWVLY